MTLTRNLRTSSERTPTRIFTPTKASVQVKNYVLNEKRTMQKMKLFTERDFDVCVEFKHGHIILEFSPAAYLHFKFTLHERSDAAKKPLWKFEIGLFS